MDLRKEIQVTLNSCEPNSNRVNKIEAIARKFADLHHSIQLLQTAVVGQSENLKCECKNVLFTRTVDSDYKPLCGNCGNPI